MSNTTVLQAIVDEYVAADAAEKAAAARKAEMKKALLDSGLDLIEGTHAKVTITESERITLDPETVRGVVTPKQFVSMISVSAEKARKVMDDEVFKACVESITKVQTVRISVKVPA